VLGELPQVPTYLICGMLNTKDITGYLRPLAPHVAGLHAVSIPGEAATLPAAATAKAALDVGMTATEAEDVAQALAQIVGDAPYARVLICGSLYLAGNILRYNS
jgi:dihydrofolate synthase/folylpolyglutamate synthase